MKIFSVFVLFLAGLVPCRADIITTPDGQAVIPDGVTITSITPLFDIEPFERIDFSFANGSGTVFADGNDGEHGTIYFTVPLLSLTVDWLNTGFAYQFWSDSSGFQCFGGPGVQCLTGGTFTFTSPVTFVQWFGRMDYTGIDSMTFTTPEPGIFWMLLTAAILLGLSRWAQISLRKLSKS